MNRHVKYLILFLLFSFLGIGLTVFASDKVNKENNDYVVSIEDFIQSATKNDEVFDEILIDNLKLAYRKDLNLPAKDLVLSVKAQNNFYLSQNRDDQDVKVSLSKLFPYIGTEVSASYENKPSLSSTTSGSLLECVISQPIAENAFGKNTRLQDKIIGVEIDVATYQIVEAYEDYLASLIALYYNWYSSYENLKIGKASYKENLKFCIVFWLII